MKKILKLSLIFAIIMFFCTGCNGTITREIRKSGFTVGGEFICDEFYPKDSEDVYYNRIQYFTGSHLIDQEGNIYELSLSQKYMDEQNCQQANTSIRVKAILDNKIIKGTDNLYYYLISQNNEESYTQIPTSDNSYDIYDILLRDEDVIKVQTANNNDGYYVLKSDGNVYEITVNRNDRNAPPTISGTRIIFDKEEYGDYIIDFNYVGDSLNTYVRTQSKLFRMKINNEEMCKKYAGITCKFNMVEDDIFEKYENRIITFNGSTLITDYKLIFTVSG